ncbi:HNH endonuclease [Candidatus Electrothrix aarhusensis]
MNPKHFCVDQRLCGTCVYCGSQPNTRDHVPSRILLDDPMPANLPVVESCEECNHGFSLDEEYIACLLECVVHGSVETQVLQRPKVKRILAKKARLATMLLESARTADDGTILWIPDEQRVHNVMLKLARGHAAFELSQPLTEEPLRIHTTPFACMSPENRDEFERAGAGEIRGWPEIGSRAFLRAVGAKPYAEQNGPWIQVQKNRYRYTVDDHGGVLVRMVLSEYLACEVEWE